MSEIVATSQWIQFFTKAGLPPNVAANYAIIFSDNRIQLNMLLDLSKEYLYDMGIKVMGDVIAILRYAKEFHAEMAKERAIGSVNQTPKKAVERMLEHYARPSLASTQRPLVAQPKPRILKKAPIVSLRKPNAEITSPKHIRRVLPQQEGTYKIKMPAGTTERTRKILQEHKRIQQLSKRSVFQRLGESAVSSTTDIDKGSSSVFERLGPSNKGLNDDLPTSTSIANQTLRLKKGAALPYRGVLKMSVGSGRTIVTQSPGTQMLRRTVINSSAGRANLPKVTTVRRTSNLLAKAIAASQQNTGSQGVLGFHTKANQGLDIKSRLGRKTDARNIARTKILATSRGTGLVRKTSTVFNRLGN